MPRAVDGLIATINAVRPMVMNTFMGDWYQITRDTRTTNSRGQPVETPNPDESGWCALNVVRFRTHEDISGGAVTVGRVRYLVTMPPATGLLDTDTLIINGRAFRVIGVKRPGELGFFVYADLEAWDEDAT